MKMKNTMPLLAGLAVLAAVIIFGFGSMEHPVRDDAGLLARAKWEMQDGEFDPDGFRIAAKAEQGDYCLIWFFCGIEGSDQYVPMEFEITGDDGYRFVSRRLPLNRIVGIYELSWKDSYSFLIANDACRYLCIDPAYSSETIRIEIEEQPFQYCYEDDGSFDCRFLDANGEELL